MGVVNSTDITDYTYNYSNTEMADSSSVMLAHKIAVVVTIACLSICFIAGVVGNALVIWIAGFKMKTVSAVWFTNLAIVDFIYSVTLPLRIVDWFGVIDAQNIFFNGALIVMMYVNSIISVIFLAVISIDRCVSVMWPLWAKIHRTRRRATISSVFMWLVPSGIFILSWTDTFPIVDKYFFIMPLHGLHYACCRALYKYPNPLIFVQNNVMFGVALIFILVCYGLIVWKLRSNTMRRPKKFQKTFRIIIAVVVLFLVCWFPYNVWPLIASCETMSHLLTDLIMSCVCLCLVSISSCINPILYVLIGRKRGRNSKTSIRARIENSLKD